MSHDTMSDEERGLQERYQLIVNAIDKHHTIFGRQISKIATVLERHIKKFVTEFSSDPLYRGEQLNQARRGIRLALTTSGYAYFVSSGHEDALVELADIVIGEREIEESRDITERSRDKSDHIEAVGEYFRQNIQSETERLTTRLWRLLVLGSLYVRFRGSILKDVEDVIDTHLRTLESTFETGLQIYARQVEELSVEPSRDDVFLYLGPDDDVTRPFCRARVGRKYTKDEIDSMDNKQLPNVFLTGGGYNCRHMWLAVDRTKHIVLGRNSVEAGSILGRVIARRIQSGRMSRGT